MTYTFEIAEQHYKPRHANSLYLTTGFACIGIGGITLLIGRADWAKTLFYDPVVSASVLGAISLAYGIALLILTFSKNKWLLQPATNRLFRITSAVLLAFLSVTFAYSLWWLPAGLYGLLSVTNLFALFYERRSSQPGTIVFAEEDIALPAVIKGKYLEWSDVNRVMVRFGILTVDCVDNHLYQWNIKMPEFSVEMFEKFCILHIEKSKSSSKTTN